MKYIAQQRTLSGALHLPIDKMIIFQFSEHIFSLEYGKESSLYLQNLLAFDIDDGFILHEWAESTVPSELSASFATWKENNYDDHIFTYLPSLALAAEPEEKSNYSNANTMARIGKFGNSIEIKNEESCHVEMTLIRGNRRAELDDENLVSSNKKPCN